MLINHATLSASLPTAVSAEGAAITLPLNTNTHPYGSNEVKGCVSVTAGTGTTLVTVRVRQGSGTGGTLVGPAFPHTLAAGASASIAFGVEDTAALVGNQYTVTVQQTGGTAAGTVNGGQADVYQAVGIQS